MNKRQWKKHHKKNIKNILISIKPQWVEKILNGEKTIEIRKTMPKYKLPCKVYIYCTKDNKNYLNRKDCRFCYIEKRDVLGITDKVREIFDNINGFYERLNGKVVAEFTLNNVEKIHCCAVPYRKTNNLGYEHFIDNGVYQLKDDYGLVFERDDTKLDTMLKNKDLKKIQLKPIDIYNYLNGYGKFYAWHIDNLKIYDKPKELDTFIIGKVALDCGYGNYNIYNKVLKKPPQSWCYVEEKGELK